jgi:hypothetical protein
MAKGKFPFAKFEKSSDDTDSAAVTKKYGKEGSPKEEAFDRKQMRPMPFEKSSGDKDISAITKKFGKEGSKKEEAFDRKQAFKAKRFAKGGGVEYGDDASESYGDTSSKINDDDLAAANASSDPIQSLADAKEGKLNKKPAVVTKEQLAASGLSLRDYLNKQQGLTRRGEKAPVAASGTTSSGGSGRGSMGGPTADELSSYGAQTKAKKEAEYAAAEKREQTPERKAARAAQADAEAPENMSADFIGGPAKLGIGLAGGALAALGLKKLMKGGAKAAIESPATRELAKKGVDEVTFLGRSGAKKIGDAAERLTGPSKAKIAMEDGKQAITNNPTKRLGGPSKVADDVEDAIPSSGRDKVTNPMAWMAGPKGMRDDFKKGGKVKAFAKGGSVRGNGIAQRGLSKGRMC